MSPELAGVIPITATPFDERDRVDEDGIAALVVAARLVPGSDFSA